MLAPAPQPGFRAVTDELLDLLEETRTVGFVLVRHELPGRCLVLRLRIRRPIPSIQTRQRSPPPLVVLTKWGALRIVRARTARAVSAPPGARV